MCQHIVDMPQPNRALRKALRLAPCSTRALAQAAGLSPALLSRVLSGERAPTPATLRALSMGLRQWAGDCLKAAEMLEQLDNARNRE